MSTPAGLVLFAARTIWDLVANHLVAIGAVLLAWSQWAQHAKLNRIAESGWRLDFRLEEELRSLCGMSESDDQEVMPHLATVLEGDDLDRMRPIVE